MTVPAREIGADPRGGPPTWPRSVAYGVPEGVAADGVLGGEGGATQHDEDEDEVGEDVVVDELMAAHADPVGETATWTQPSAGPVPPACWGCSTLTGQAEDSCPCPHPANQSHLTLSPSKVTEGKPRGPTVL